MTKKDVATPGNWEEAERSFWRILLLCTILGVTPMVYWYSLKALGFYLLGVLTFAAEFKLLIWVVRLLLGTLKGNFLAVAGVILGKVLVWFALAGSPFWLPSGMRIPFGIGCGVFAFSLIVLLAKAGGRPKLENV